jgi:16S rRNA (uracil1498-N3)-methyltransferase
VARCWQRREGLFLSVYRKRLVWAAWISQLLGMARYRSFLFADATVGEGFLILDARESHHLVRVFRAKVGATIEVLDGKGTRYLGTIEIANGKAVRVAVASVETMPAPQPRVTLLQSIPKGKAMDLILRMATEIGASVIQPVFTDQGEHGQPKMDKWQLSIIEACKQCGLSYVPELSEPCSLGDWLQATPAADGALRITASLEEGSRPLLETLNAAGSLDEVVVAVGPAGDFSVAEYDQLRESGFKAVRLGAHVLRTETAAAYILSVVDQAAR